MLKQCKSNQSIIIHSIYMTLMALMIEAQQYGYNGID